MGAIDSHMKNVGLVGVWWLDTCPSIARGTGTVRVFTSQQTIENLPVFSSDGPRTPPDPYFR